MRHFVLPEILRGEVTGAEAESYAEGKRSPRPHPLGGYDTVRIGQDAVILFTAEGVPSRYDGPAVVHPHHGQCSFWTDGILTPLHLHLRARNLPGVDTSDPDDFVDAADDFRDGLADYHLFVDALRNGSPVEWALAFARGEVRA